MDDFMIRLLAVGDDYYEDPNYPKVSAKETLEFFSNPDKKIERKEKLTESRQYFFNKVAEIKEKKHTLANLTKFSQDELESFYYFAYETFKNGQFDKSFDVFRLAVILDPTDFRFMYGLGQASQHLGHYILAGTAFNIASCLQPENPVPCLCAGECYFHLDDPFNALLSLEQAIEISADNKKYEPIKTRALLQYDNIMLECLTLSNPEMAAELEMRQEAEQMKKGEPQQQEEIDDKAQQILNDIEEEEKELSTVATKPKTKKKTKKKSKTKNKAPIVDNDIFDF